MPAGQHDPRDAGHAGTADADEVHPAELHDGVGGRRRLTLPATVVAAASRHHAGRVVASASRPAEPRRQPRPSRANRSRVEQQGQHVLAHPSGVQCGVVDEQPAAGLDDRLGD